MLDVTARRKSSGTGLTGITGGERVSMGPVVVWYKSNLMIRAEYKFPIHEKAIGTQNSYGKQVHIGIGVTY